MILHAVAVPPAAGAGGLAIAGIGLCIAFVVAWGLQSFWRATFGPFLTWLGNRGLSFSVRFTRVVIHPFRFAHSVNRNIEQALDWAVSNAERGMVWCFATAVALLKNIAHTIEQVALDAYHGVRGVSHTATVTVTRTIRQTVVKPVETTVRVTSAVSKATVARLTHALGALDARVGHLAHTVAVDVARAPARVGATPKQLRRMLRSLTRLEKATVGLGAAALVATALARLGLGWVRCAKVGKLGKAACGMNTRWFDDVLGLFTDFLVLENICRVIPLLEEGFSVVAAPLIGTLAGAGAGICSAEFQHGAPLEPPRLYLPDPAGDLNVTGV